MHLQGFWVQKGLGCMLFHAVLSQKTRNLALPWLENHVLFPQSQQPIYIAFITFSIFGLISRYSRLFFRSLSMAGGRCPSTPMGLRLVAAENFAQCAFGSLTHRLRERANICGGYVISETNTQNLVTVLNTNCVRIKFSDFNISFSHSAQRSAALCYSTGVWRARSGLLFKANWAPLWD